MNYREKIKELKSKVQEMREKMLKLQSLYELPNTDVHDGLDLVQECFPNLMDIRYINGEIQKVVLIDNKRILKIKRK